jgi:hypothetical protein
MQTASLPSKIDQEARHKSIKVTLWRPRRNDADVLHTAIVAIPSPLIGWVIDDPSCPHILRCRDALLFGRKS